MNGGLGNERGGSKVWRKLRCHTGENKERCPENQEESGRRVQSRGRCLRYGKDNGQPHKTRKGDLSKAGFEGTRYAPCNGRTGFRRAPFDGPERSRNKGQIFERVPGENKNHFTSHECSHRGYRRQCDLGKSERLRRSRRNGLSGCERTR